MKNFFKKIMPKWEWQTKDNCVSLVEQWESEELWDELNARIEVIERLNIKRTLNKLKRYIQRQAILDGLNPTLAQLEIDAARFFFQLKNCGYIDDFNNLSVNIEECFK